MPAVCISLRINNIAIQSKLSNNKAREIAFCMFNDRDDGEYNGFGLVKISETLVKQEVSFKIEFIHVYYDRTCL